MINKEFRRLLISDYQALGNKYLAYRLQKLFKRLDTPADVALHNDIADEIAIMIGEDKSNIKLFLDGIADIIVTREPPKKTFLRKVASYILQIAVKKG